MPASIYAVITGEVADSRKISQSKLGKVPDMIRKVIDRVNSNLEDSGKLEFEIIRMDEFLCMSKDVPASLQTLLMLASNFRSLSQHELGLKTGLRLSMGIGPVELNKEQLRESDGTAFRIADEGLRKMKRNQRLVIASTDDQVNEELIVACGFMDILLHDWSDEQAEALFMCLSVMNQMSISEKLDISQPAVNRRLKAAHMEATERFLDRFYSIFGN